jgi:Protein involved in formate dehydrogenase formation
MPYVTIPAISRSNLLVAAERRWTAVRLARPDLEPALALQHRLLTLITELTATLEGGRIPRLSLPPKYLAAKLARGVPAFTGEPIPLPAPAMRPALLGLCEALEAGGAGQAAAHIRTSIDAGAIEAGSLLTASLNRDQTAIRTGAVHRGLAPDLVWLIAELAVSPFAYLLQRTLLGGEVAAALDAALDSWPHGYCPACGSWPAIGEVVGGHRTLRCSFCSSAWELRTYACIYCAESGEAFVTSAPNRERTDRRLELCSSCGGYLKTADLPELSPFPLLSISDIETTDLDVAAMKHGYGRPPLKDFAIKR